MTTTVPQPTRRRSPATSHPSSPRSQQALIGFVPPQHHRTPRPPSFLPRPTVRLHHQSPPPSSSISDYADHPLYDAPPPDHRSTPTSAITTSSLSFPPNLAISPPRPVPAASNQICRRRADLDLQIRVADPVSTAYRSQVASVPVSSVEHPDRSPEPPPSSSRLAFMPSTLLPCFCDRPEPPDGWRIVATTSPAPLQPVRPSPFRR